MSNETEQTVREEARATATAGDAPGQNPHDRNGRRRKLLGIVLGVFLLLGIGYGAYWAVFLRNTQSTDDAYVNGNVVPITPQIVGTVLAIEADDTDYVPAGKTLVRLDPADAKVALAQAESELAKTVRQVRTLYATSSQLEATLRQREADLARARDDLQRRERVANSGAVSGEELQHARDAFKTAEAAVAAARDQLKAQQALIDNTTIENHPDVKNAAAHLHEAYLTYMRTTIPAPISGYVAKRSVQIGQRVSPGSPLMTVVTLDRVWVDANFKEGQLKNMRVGQPATLTADIYGGKVDYHGKVIGFGAGTGGAFALLPAQNASGNWIKIVQRVPVRIAIDRSELEKHPLQVGLSMQVKVDTADESGERLPHVANSTPVSASGVFSALDRDADRVVQTIIAENRGHSQSDSTRTVRRTKDREHVAQAADSAPPGR
jgi:membrane fusion protein, multidrug efflux system